ncbi:hypothetical protein Bbelb_045610 [Branchiostoma belcheri]|nr:hypothetical protein Bbelb_045610 [Branchiostoma belcheri]
MTCSSPRQGDTRPGHGLEQGRHLVTSMLTRRRKPVSRGEAAVRPGMSERSGVGRRLSASAAQSRSSPRRSHNLHAIIERGDLINPDLRTIPARHDGLGNCT